MVDKIRKTIMVHEKEKQKRMVCHLQYKGRHYYFGNLKVLTDNFGKEQLGVGYKSRANHFVNHSKFFNDHCIIIKGELVTSKRGICPLPSKIEQ